MLVTITPTAEGRPIRNYLGIVVGEMQHRAMGLGANAIVGVDLDYEALGDKSSMLMVTVSGTAVQI